MKKVLFEAAATCATALALAGCGGGDEDGGASAAATATPPAQVTPLPTGTPAATATGGIHEGDATATPTPTAPGGTGGAEAGELPPQAGDEEGIRVPVEVAVSAGGIATGDEPVAAFLPLRLRFASFLDREVQVVVTQAGEGGGPLARVTLPPFEQVTADVPGQQPGTLDVLSPDLGANARATIEVRPGG